MTAETRRRTPQVVLALLATGEETGWWWREEFDGPDSGWVSAGEPNDPKPGKPPF